jgi:hypothetical protein
MDLGSGGAFTSDIDIIARLHDFPKSQQWLYKTWEVKVSLLCKDGTARSLKRGKLPRTLTQLTAYKDFGCPAVSLLDVYVCEAGFMRGNAFPPDSLKSNVSSKIDDLRRRGFGYQLLPFEHGEDGADDVGLIAMHSALNPLQTTFNLLPAVSEGPRQPFSRLAERLSEFFESAPDRPRKSFNQIVFCKDCRQLQLISMKDEHNCRACQADLIVQC